MYLDAEERKKELMSLQEFLDSVGVPLLFVQVPPKISREDINVNKHKQMLSCYKQLKDVSLFF